MGINQRIDLFGKNIEKAINESNLPPYVVKIVLENALLQVQAQIPLAIAREGESEKEGATDGNTVRES